ncbi:MAG: YdiU family protein, partial [Betaproteobacteria bacterium]|nr:YdiU family protein [Betaproteobacteria bacterium]
MNLPLPAHVMAAEPPALRWLNTYARLGDALYTRLPAEGLPQPRLAAFSAATAAQVGLPADAPQRLADLVDVFSGNATWPGMEPLATVYSGHQFGAWAGQLGDGRALLLGEVAGPQGPVELQLKGSGLTPYSRMGDGRAVLRSSVREFLCSEAMAGLGVATTRALCLTASSLPVQRETLETAAVLTRVAPSFVRFGHFEHFCHHGEHDALRRLTDYVIDRFYPACRDAGNPATALLGEVTLRTADLLAHWQAVGFCHGVMNTDNMSILGLTIDYGPFGFLDGYDPAHICNHSDHLGRYAYGRQPQVAYWNLFCLAQALLPLIGDTDAAAAALEPYKARYAAQWRARIGAKLGLREAQADDEPLIQGMFDLLAAQRADFTGFFRELARLRVDEPEADGPLRDQFADRAAFDAWAALYRQRLRRDARSDAERAAAMNAVNPKFVLRNYLAETAIRQASQGDFDEIARLQQVLARPFDEQPQFEAYAAPPPDWAAQIAVSC